MAVMRGNRVGGNWLMKWDELKNSHGTTERPEVVNINPCMYTSVLCDKKEIVRGI